MPFSRQVTSINKPQMFYPKDDGSLAQEIKSERGESLIEVLLVVVILGFIVMLMSNLPNAVGLIQKSKFLGLAREIAVKQIEDQRQKNFTNLVDGSLQITDSRLSLLPSGSGTVVVEPCDIQICTNSEDVKQITVTVNWSVANTPQYTVLKTFVGQGGLNQ